MEIGEDGENGQHAQQRVVMVRGKEQENVTVLGPKEKENTARMMEVDVMKWKIVTVDSIVQLIKVNLVIWLIYPNLPRKIIIMIKSSRY